LSYTLMISINISYIVFRGYLTQNFADRKINDDPRLHNFSEDSQL
jgi:hypothetical protein